MFDFFTGFAVQLFFRELQFRADLKPEIETSSSAAPQKLVRFLEL